MQIMKMILIKIQRIKKKINRKIQKKLIKIVKLKKNLFKMGKIMTKKLVFKAMIGQRLNLNLLLLKKLQLRIRKFR